MNISVTIRNDSKVGENLPRKPRFLDRVQEAIRTCHYSPRTEKAYVAWIKRFTFFNDTRHPRDIGPFEVTRFSQRSQGVGMATGFSRNSHLSGQANRRTEAPSPRQIGHTTRCQERCSYVRYHQAGVNPFASSCFRNPLA